MTDNERFADAAGLAAPTGDSEIMIERDSRFTRWSIDSVYSIDRGNDIQLCLIEQGPSPCSIKPAGTLNPSEMQLSLQGTYTEVGRITLQPATAVNMAMQILEQALKAGRLKMPQFKDAVDLMFDSHVAGGAVDGDGTAA